MHTGILSRRLVTPLALAFGLAACGDSSPPPPICAEASEPVTVGVTPEAPEADCAGDPGPVGVVFESQATARQAALELARTELLDPNTITVVTCGTGSPVPSTRAQSCTAVFVNGTFLLFDAGDDAQRSIEALNLPVLDLAAVFLTHFHSDHIADLGEVISRSWILGRQGSLPIYGGAGVTRLVDGFNLVYSLDNAYRRAHHGDSAFPTGSEGAHANEIATPDADGTVVYAADGVRVIAFAVNHAPIEPALGYRIEYAGKSVVISGDTTDTPTLRAMSAGADVLVSEVMSKEFAADAECALDRLGDQRNSDIFRDIRTYHIDATELGTLAEEAGVAHLVLTHQVPAVDERLLQTLLFGAPISAVYNGMLTIAVDGTRVSIPVE